MAVVFDRPNSLEDVSTHFCPGCGHGIVHRLVCEVLDEMGVIGDTIAVVPVGCSVMSYNYFGCDVIQAPHGRAPAVATGAKRVNPDKVVFTYQGDGDLAAIGTAETVHSGTRGENIVIIFINNTTYGMTGGQMAPTTLPGQVTQTTPFGRNTDTAGFPIRMCELMSTLSGVALAQRVAIDSVPHIREAKKAIRKAFDNQVNKRGLSIVEVLSTCPTNWGLSPEASMEFVKDKMIPYYPLGVYKDKTAEEEAAK
ncbi:MAG: 2-oxoglutarate oxidoreductase [Ruminococcus sp.]|nr:2-oxoglutarate oxidoreductase [Ruminococcus sp.]